MMQQGQMHTPEHEHMLPMRLSLLGGSEVFQQADAKVICRGVPVLSFSVKGVYELIGVQKWPCWHTQNTCRGPVS